MCRLALVFCTAGVQLNHAVKEGALTSKANAKAKAKATMGGRKGVDNIDVVVPAPSARARAQKGKGKPVSSYAMANGLEAVTCVLNYYNQDMNVQGLFSNGVNASPNWGQMTPQAAAAHGR